MTYRPVGVQIGQFRNSEFLDNLFEIALLCFTVQEQELRQKNDINFQILGIRCIITNRYASDSSP